MSKKWRTGFFEKYFQSKSKYSRKYISFSYLHDSKRSNGLIYISNICVQMLLFWYLDNLSAINLHRRLTLSMLRSFWKSTWREDSESDENQKIQYDVIFSNDRGIVEFFNQSYICLIKLSVWSRSHINMTFISSTENLFYITDLLCCLYFAGCVETKKPPW